jgi:DNA-binding transcriptional ArsR family regulator
VLTYNQMIVVTPQEKASDQLFGALSNATRRDIVTRTMYREYSVSQLSRRYSTSFAAVQKHVAVLEKAGLVSKRAKGREQLVSGNAESLRNVHELLNQLEAGWRERIGQFEEVLKTTDQRKAP